MENIPTNDFEIVSKNITNLLDYNDIKAVVPKSPMVAVRSEDDNHIHYLLLNRTNAGIRLTIRKSTIDNLNELVSFTTDGNHRKSLGIVKALLEHKLTWKVK